MSINPVFSAGSSKARYRSGVIPITTESLVSVWMHDWGNPKAGELVKEAYSRHGAMIGDLPLYNLDDDATSEYNRSISGVLKNAIDHASRRHAQNAWAGKPAGVLGASTGVIGTALAQQHLRNILAHLDIPTLCQPEAFIQVRDGLLDEAGNIGEGSRHFLQNWMDHYVAWVKKHAV